MSLYPDILTPGQNVPMAALRDRLVAGERGSRRSPDPMFDPIFADIGSITNSELGQARIEVDLEGLFRSQFSPGGTKKYVAPWGSDSNNGNSYASAYLTGAKVRTVSCDIAEFAPGEYAPFDWRHTDTGGTTPRMFFAPWGARIRTASTDVSGLTYTVNGTYSNVYETALVGPPTVIRLLRTDFLDSVGRYMPMPRFGSLAALATAGYGWYHDTAADMLYVCVGGTNIESSFKSKLVAVYANSTNNQCLIFGPCISYWQGFTFQGGPFWGLSANGIGTPTAYLKNCHFEYTYSHALLQQGGKLYHQDCTGYRVGGDAGNYNEGVQGEDAYFVEDNFRTLWCGDEDSFPGQVHHPVVSGFNKQASSNHSAIGVAASGHHDGHAGQLIGETGPTYRVGTTFGRSRAPVGSGFASALFAQNTPVWYEEMSPPASGDATIVADGTAVIHNFQLRGARSGSGTFTDTIPLAA